jgi:hypothetical protein
MAPSEWTCNSCGSGFETRGRRDSHHRKEHQNVLIERHGDSLRHELRRSRQGKFFCECKREYETSQALKKHRTRCTQAILEQHDENDQEHVIEGTFPVGQ